MRPSDGWKRVQARQYYCTAQPGYVWAATIHLAPLMWIRGWDCYLRGAPPPPPIFVQGPVHRHVHNAALVGRHLYRTHGYQSLEACSKTLLQQEGTRH